MKKLKLCPCGSGKTQQQCCLALHAGAIADSAAALMRSRYTAFVLQNENYLLDTWHIDNRPTQLDLADQTNIKWVGLKILSHQTGNDKATVEFIARYKVNGKAEKIHELSRFIRQQGRWFYVDGDNID